MLGFSDDDFNQAEPTPEQIAEHKVKQPRLQREALKGYETALNKIQSCGVGTFCPDILLPDFKALYASIEAERDKLPKPKKQFGR